MPLDDTTGFLAPARTRPREKEMAICDRMLELLATPERWCKRTYKTKNSYCLLGALDHSVGSYYTTGRYVENQLRRFSTWDGVFISIADFNDSRKTKHADILALIRRTRASFEAEG